jgi:lysyl endopeptidase
MRGPLHVAARTALALAVFAACASAQARHGEPPYTFTHSAKALRAAPVERVGAIDATVRRSEADASARAAAPTKRLRTADTIATDLDAERSGAWTNLADGSRLWRVTVEVAGATDLRLAFSRFALPSGATLHVIGADRFYQGPYTSADSTDGTFHSPVVPGDRATIELHVPAGADVPRSALAIASIGAGFRDLFKRIDGTGPGTSGACNVNVACPLGTPYPDERRAVAYYEYEDDEESGIFLCSGTLVADVPQDKKNYFLTAAHCVDSASEAASMVLYWNYESAACNSLVAPAGGFFADDQHGAALRASRADADFALVQLATTPDPDWRVFYAGWDATNTNPSGTIGMHHPFGDVKKITAGPSPGTTDNCIGTGGASVNTHWETGPYLQGTTQGGSSGSGLFVVAGNGGGHDRRVIGVLSGGFADCSASDPREPNDETDCYGKLASAWNGASAATRLRDWLDPAGTGNLIGAGIDSAASPSLPTRGHSRHRRPDGLPGSRE